MGFWAAFAAAKVALAKHEAHELKQTEEVITALKAHNAPPAAIQQAETIGAAQA